MKDFSNGGYQLISLEFNDISQEEIDLQLLDIIKGTTDKPLVLTDIVKNGVKLRPVYVEIEDNECIIYKRKLTFEQDKITISESE